MWGEPMAPALRVISSPSTVNFSPPLSHFHPNNPLSFEDQAVHQAVGPDGEVQAVAAHVKIAEGRAPADAVGVVHRAWSDARCHRAGCGPGNRRSRRPGHAL